MRHAHSMNHGATVLPDNRALFRIWAPSAAHMRISIDGAEPMPMHREPADWFSLEADAAPGATYAYILPDGLNVPDPTSRLQANDVHGPSVLVDPLTFEWQQDWNGRTWRETVLYEAHPGAMGGFNGIAAQLEFLRDTGITAIELMPVAEFPGQRNWGYDGVLPYAPDAAYGTPDDLKRLIDKAHGLGLMMFLDVVYNHFGPEGAYLHTYAKSFFTEDFHTPWGIGIDFRRRVVQDYFCDNALYWLNEYRFDGLRFDAVGAIQPFDFLFLLAGRIRLGVERTRHIHLVMENEFNQARFLRGSFDAQWTDDIHHAFHVLLTGETFGYYEDFVDATALLLKSLTSGFAFQGEVSPHSGQKRGEHSGDLPTTCFVAFLQNHDQIGNRAIGDRLTATIDPAALRAARAFLLLCPFIPMLFMGEEWATKTPFQFFIDPTDAALREAVRQGRRREFGAFFGDHTDEMVPDPAAAETFEASRLDFAEAQTSPYREEHALTRHLLTLRHTHIVPHLQAARSAGARALAPAAVDASWTLDDGSTLRIALNLSTAPVSFEPPTANLLYASDEAAAQAAKGGSLAGTSIVVCLSTLAEDASPHGIVFA